MDSKSTHAVDTHAQGDFGMIKVKIPQDITFAAFGVD
jgi:hypothetical protein